MEKNREKGRNEFYNTKAIVQSRHHRGKHAGDDALSQPSACVPTENADEAQPVEADGKRKPQTIVFSKLEELPTDLEGTLARMKVSPQDLEANLSTLANILSFDDKVKPKRRFYTPEQFAPTQVKGYSKEKALNRHPPRMLIPAHELFKPMEVRSVKKIFKMSDFLGEGGFGNVVKGRLLQKGLYGPNVTAVAIKYQDGSNVGERNLVAMEASIMRYCQHPVIVKLYDCYTVHQECWLVCELLEGGTLKEAAESSSTWDESEIAYVARKMLTGLQYLHGEKLAHRDLKNLNVMFTVHAEVKLIDFGLCADLTNGPTVAMVGSPFWMAPEMIRGEFHSFPVDIWSFMVCLLELANRHPPDSSNVKRALFNRAVYGFGKDAGLENRAAWSDVFVDFLSQGFQMDSSKRATATQLLEHPFLAKSTSREHMSKMLSQIFTMKTLAISGI